MSSSAIVSSICTGICIDITHVIPIPMVGIVVTGAGGKQIEGNNAARVGDIVMGYCGHIGIIISGQGDVSVENQSQSTVGGAFAGIFSGVISTGASTHKTGG